MFTHYSYFVLLPPGSVPFLSFLSNIRMTLSLSEFYLSDSRCLSKSLSHLSLPGWRCLYLSPCEQMCIHHKVRTYKEYHSVCSSSELGLSQPLSRQRVFPSPQKQGGGGTLACGWGFGGSPNSDEGHALWYSLYVRTLWYSLFSLCISCICCTFWRTAVKSPCISLPAPSNSTYVQVYQMILTFIKQCLKNSLFYFRKISFNLLTYKKQNIALCRACLHSFFIGCQSVRELRITSIPRDAVI